jgi:uncharacterized protein
MGHKAGDNAQVSALADALGWPYEIKRFQYNRFEVVPNFLLGVTLRGIAAGRSSDLQPPWPDLVIGAGRRNEPIARWIRRAASADGHHVRLVHLGRPWSRLSNFDLIVTTPQYRLPERPNVLLIAAPLHGVTKQRLAEAAAQWRERFAHLPRPRVAVLVGGSVAPFEYDDRAAERLARQASSLAITGGGSLLISTSPRTPPATIDTLCAHLTVPFYVFRWRKEATENPFHAMLATADSIIVTGDSMSMLAEACATGRRVYIFDLGEGDTSMRPRARESAPRPAGNHKAPGPRAKALVLRVVKRLTPARLSRDIRVIHAYFVDSGAAVWLGDEFPGGAPRPLADGIAQVVDRVRAMFGLPPAAVVATPTGFEPVLPP